jgi:hypothetical protein
MVRELGARSAWDDAMAEGPCTADAVEYNALAAIERSALPRAPFLLGDGPTAPLTFVGPPLGGAAGTRPDAIPADLAAALGGAWLSDAGLGGYGTYRTPARADTAHSRYGGPVVRGERIYWMTPEGGEAESPLARQRVTAVDPVTGREALVLGWQGPARTWTMDPTATNVIVLRPDGILEIRRVDGRGHRLFDLPASAETVWSLPQVTPSGRTVVLPVGEERLTGVIVVDLETSVVREVAVAEMKGPGLALGERHMVDRTDNVNGGFRLVDLASGGAQEVRAMSSASAASRTPSAETGSCSRATETMVGTAT